MKFDEYILNSSKAIERTRFCLRFSFLRSSKEHDWKNEYGTSSGSSVLHVFMLLKELIIIFLFVVTAAGVVPCGIPKKRPRTSSIVQFIFYFWSFEISRNTLRNQKTLSV